MSDDAKEKKDEVVEDQDDETGKEDQSDETGKNTGEDDSKKTKTFTQDEVNKMMAREKRQGKNSVLNELGIDPKDKEALKSVKDLLESRKSDDQKAQEEQSKLQDYEKRAKIAETKSEAMLLGVKPSFVEDVVTLALAKINASADDIELKDVINEYKTKNPQWFSSTGDDEEDKASKGTGKSVKPNGGKTEETKSLGSRLAAQRKSSTKKSSYWK